MKQGHCGRCGTALHTRLGRPAGEAACPICPPKMIAHAEMPSPLHSAAIDLTNAIYDLSAAGGHADFVLDALMKFADAIKKDPP